MGEVNVGLVGAGLIGGFHSRAIRGVFKMGLVKGRYVAVGDVIAKRAEMFALVGIPIWTGEPLTVIDNPDINTVYICTHTAAHKDLVLRAAAAGKNVFCEKPLAKTLDDAREMYEAVIKAGVRHQVGLVLRHSPVFNVLRDLLQDPALGRPMTAIMRDDQFFPIQGHYASTWRGDFEKAGGGTLLEHSIHDLDILTFLLGPVDGVRALTRNFAGHEGVEDFGSVVLHFASGCTGHLVSIWHNVLSRGSTRLLEVFFENGYFSVERDFLQPIHYDTCASDGPRTMDAEEVGRRYLELAGVTDPQVAGIMPRWSLEDYFFLKAIEEERDPAPGFEVGLRAHVLLDCIYRSAAAGGRELEVPQT